MWNVTSQLYSLDKLKELASGDEEFITNMIKMFLAQAPKMTTDIVEAYKQNDLARVKAVAHKLKPSLDFMGIYDLLEDVREIESLAMANQRGERIESLIQKLKEVIAEACKQLKEELT